MDGDRVQNPRSSSVLLSRCSHRLAWRFQSPVSRKVWRVSSLWCLNATWNILCIGSLLERTDLIGWGGFNLCCGRVGLISGHRDLTRLRPLGNSSTRQSMSLSHIHPTTINMAELELDDILGKAALGGAMD